jgi:hypothetical protein
MTTDPFTDSGRLPAHSRKATRAVVRELTSAAANSRTGVLRVAGDRGGDLHVRHGKVVAVRAEGRDDFVVVVVCRKSVNVGMLFAQARRVMKEAGRF